jgi:Zn-dependent peptidase ImmA (M78 family)
MLRKVLHGPPGHGRRRPIKELPAMIEAVFDLRPNTFLQPEPNLRATKPIFCRTVPLPSDLHQMVSHVDASAKLFSRFANSEDRIGRIHPRNLGKSARDEPADAAETMRDLWTLGSISPIPSLLFILGHAGISLPLADWTGTEQPPLAAGGWFHGQPFVAINQYRRKERVEEFRYALATEFGRIVFNNEMKTDDSASAEKAASEFARAFLLPVRAQRLFRNKRYAQAELETLSVYYGVSYELIISRLEDWNLAAGTRPAALRRQLRAFPRPVQTQCNEEILMDPIWESRRRQSPSTHNIPVFWSGEMGKESVTL